MRREKAATVRRVPKDETEPLKFWQATIELPTGSDGKRRRRAIRSRDFDTTQRKLQLALHEERSKVRRPKTPALPEVPALTPSGTTAEWLNYWMTAIASLELKPKTAAGYRSALKQQILPQIGHVPLVELSASRLRAMNADILASGRAPATALHAHHVLSAALHQAFREGYVHRNVATQVKPPRVPKPILATLTPDEIRHVLDTTATDRLGSRWAAALLTGARQGELLGLELDRVAEDTIDLSWQLQRLTWSHGCSPFCGWIRGTDCPERTILAAADHERRHLTGGLWLTRPKSMAGWRTLPLVEPLRSAIAQRVQEARAEYNPHCLLWTSDPFKRDGEVIAGKPIDPRSDSSAWHAILDRSDVSQTRLHDARHAVVDLLYEAGVSEVVVNDVVGHSTVDMSRRYRSRRAAAPMVDALASLSSLLGR